MPGEQALWNLAFIPDNKVAVAAAGAIEAVVPGDVVEIEDARVFACDMILASGAVEVNEAMLVAAMQAHKTSTGVRAGVGVRGADEPLSQHLRQQGRGIGGRRDRSPRDGHEDAPSQRLVQQYACGALDNLAFLIREVYTHTHTHTLDAPRQATSHSTPA